MRTYLHHAVLLVSLSLSGCGYHLSGGMVGNGAGQTLSVPLFVNETREFRLEQELTEAVRRELIRRTRYQVVPGNAGDLRLEGSVRRFDATPVIFTDQGRGTAYDVAIEVRVTLSDTATGMVLFEADRWPFREVFEVSNESVVFVPEDTAAISRLAEQFAETLVASLNAGL